jgi:putative flavoprotein involved in K+ transport
MESVDTVVIGAGQAGLSASYHLTQQGIEHVVLERGRVGETWRSERWDGFVLNTPNWTLQLPGFHYAGAEPDGFAPLTAVIGYFEEYAESFSAPVREGAEVTHVSRDDDGFLVETVGDAVAAHSVIVAAGSYQRPTPAPLGRDLSEDVFQLHTRDYRRPEQLPDGGVLVVGSGQSGCQIADELVDAGRRVVLSVGRCPWFPRVYRGREVMHWLVETGRVNDTLESLPSPAARLACNPPVSGNDGGHDCNPRWLARRGVDLVGRIAGADGEVVRFAEGLEASLAAGDEFLAEFQRRVDEYVSLSGLDVPEAEPAEPARPAPHVPELDLRAAGVGTVLWANGFRPDHSWIEGVETDEQGWPLHERGVSPVAGLFFVGLHWLYRRKSALLIGVGEDAEYVVSRLAER